MKWLPWITRRKRQRFLENLKHPPAPKRNPHYDMENLLEQSVDHFAKGNQDKYEASIQALADSFFNEYEDDERNVRRRK